jgi:hypothetical protein
MSDAFSTQRQAWQGMIEQPLAFVADRCVRECLPAELDDKQYRALRHAPRFNARLLQRLSGHFNLHTAALQTPPHDEDLPVLLLSAEQFQRLPRLCGAIWHSATLSREIRSHVVNQLRGALGIEVFAQALAHRSLAGAADLLRQPADLVQAIDRDGAACVLAWLQQQPAGLAAWLRLRLDVPFGDEPATTAAATFDPHIVRRAAATFNDVFSTAAGEPA